MEKETLYILDASGFIHRAYFALPDMMNPAGEGTKAVFGFVRSIQKLVKDFSPRYMVAVFDGEDNKRSRRELYANYKTNRIQKFPDYLDQRAKIKQFCSLIGLPILERPGVEADDVIASITKTILGAQDLEICVCTADKDLLQLVQEGVYTMNPWKDYVQYREEDVKEFLGVYPKRIPDYLALVGDSSDNIPGVSGIGPKGAVDLLKTHSDVESIVENIDAISGAKGDKLRTQKDVLILSKKLAVLDDSLEVSGLLSDYLFLRDEGSEELQLFYKKQGFKTLIAKTVSLEETFLPTIVSNSDQVLQMVEQLRGREVAFSCAYTGKDIPSLCVQGIALAAEGLQEVFYCDFSRKEVFVQEALAALFLDADTSFIGYNVKRDLHALLSSGFPLPRITFDLALAEHLVSGGAKETFSSLLMKYDFFEDANLVSSKEFWKLSLPINGLPDNPESFFARIVRRLPAIKVCLAKELDKKGLSEIFKELEMPLEKVLLEMERVGIFVNKGELESLSKELHARQEVLVEEIYSLVGERFNIKSPKQLANILFVKLGLQPPGKMTTKAEALEALSGAHPVIDKILLFRSYEKLLSTYVDVLPKLVSKKTQRIHPTFNQVNTATGRLSCRDPNLQNIPVRADKDFEVRMAFEPDDLRRKSFLAADYSQIELRFLAHLSQDERLCEAFVLGEDVHASTAANVFGVSIDKVTRKQRKMAKVVNFGLVYGQQAYGLSKVLRISLQEAKDLIEAYFSKYPKVKIFIDETIERASLDQKVKTLMGRERVIEDWSEAQGARAASGRLAVNTIIQGSAAELIKIAMCNMAEELKERSHMKSRMILQIHDELLFEAPDTELEELEAIVKNIMESAMKLSVPLVTNILIGKNWSEC
ncbi:DNA polymerase I [Chlamydiifrater phoenicopteri]|uniref:DNA polymerase I n=1 Tax=Chlamydiifrater phoenicopteri TaxID=2681469 RepID=UPI001BCDF51E|nr:DNA polymerase I [Chlamydiifrater phoenicopteri]